MTLTPLNGRIDRLSVVDACVVHELAAAALESTPGESLLLVTCYPFDAVDPGTPWRYVVRATSIAMPETDTGNSAARSESRTGPIRVTERPPG